MILMISGVVMMMLPLTEYWNGSSWMLGLGVLLFVFGIAERFIA